MQTLEYIPVTVDKSHIITIGERLYTESIEFIRELVNNAYDADATEVRITVKRDSVEIEDNGTGMDREGLVQYFNIGSQYKLRESKSPIFKRDRIGQFGIGKFATLAACQRFEVLTRKGDFVGRVVFDKDEWEKNPSEWRLPLEVLPLDARRYDGTTVRLLGLQREFRLEDIETKIIEGTPLKAPNFRVILNGHTIKPRSLSGHTIPVLEGTPFGPVTGEIIILPETAASTENMGIEVKVKQVTVTREFFGMETWGKAMARVRGEVNADFLPVTSDRTGFIRDSEEFRAFLTAMEKVMAEVKTVLHRLTLRKEGKKVSKALNEALKRVYRALAKNPDLSPFGAIPIAGDEEGIGGGGVVTEKREGDGREEVKPLNPEIKNGVLPPQKKSRKRRNPLVKKITPNAVVKKVRFGQTGVTCCVDSFGENAPEVFSEDTTIYINKDHPLYKKESKRIETHVLNLARLITQEIALMHASRNPRQAFQRQSKLLKDALVDE